MIEAGLQQMVYTNKKQADHKGTDHQAHNKLISVHILPHREARSDGLAGQVIHFCWSGINSLNPPTPGSNLLSQTIPDDHCSAFRAKCYTKNKRQGSL